MLTWVIMLFVGALLQVAEPPAQEMAAGAARLKLAEAAGAPAAVRAAAVGAVVHRVAVAAAAEAEKRLKNIFNRRIPLKKASFYFRLEIFARFGIIKEWPEFIIQLQFPS